MRKLDLLRHKRGRRMQRRGWLGLLSCLLAPLAGCTSPKSLPQVGEEPRSTGYSATDQVVTLQFTDATPGLAVSCEGCPGIPHDARFIAQEFPPLASRLARKSHSSWLHRDSWHKRGK